jgi:glycosyltransferase involved in cell wall biosynthesis
MKIGIEALIERIAGSPNHAYYFIMDFVKYLSNLDKIRSYYIFTENYNQHLFSSVNCSNITIVPCKTTGRSRLSRIITQQVEIPILLKRYNINIYCSLVTNAIPIFSSSIGIFKLTSMHHCYFKREFGWLRYIYRNVITRLSCSKAKAIITNSNSLTCDVLKYVDSSYKKKIIMIPEAADLSFSDDISIKQLQNELNKNCINSPYILYVSGLSWYKNAHTLIKAFAILKKEYNMQHKLLIVGSGNAIYCKYLYGICRENNIVKDVVFVGYKTHEELKFIYKGADAFVYPSLYESFGHPPLEAFASGIPVVASNVMSIPEVCGDAAILVNPLNEREIAEAIVAVINDKSLKERLIKKGYERIRMFSWEKMISEFMKLFDRVMAGE